MSDLEQVVLQEQEIKHAYNTPIYRYILHYIHMPCTSFHVIDALSKIIYARDPKSYDDDVRLSRKCLAFGHKLIKSFLVLWHDAQGLCVYILTGRGYGKIIIAVRE